MNRRLALFLLIWIVLLAGVATLDGPIARWIASHGRADRSFWPFYLLWLMGRFWVTLLAAGFAWWLHDRKGRAAAQLCLGVLMVGVVEWLAKWVIGRPRPLKGFGPEVFHPFAKGWMGLVMPQDDLGCPSGHAGVAFATAMGLALLFPKGRWAFFTVAMVVALARVAELAHYPSDIVAGAGAGCLCALLARRVLGVGATG